MTARKSTTALLPRLPVKAEPRRSLLPLPAPLTTEARLERIEELGKRVQSYVQFMCAVGGMSGSSAEAKEVAVTAFYARLTALEQQLGRIHDDLQLG